MNKLINTGLYPKIDRYAVGIDVVMEDTEAIKEYGFDHGDNLGDSGIWDKRYFYEQIPQSWQGMDLLKQLEQVGEADWLENKPKDFLRYITGSEINEK